MSSVKRGRLAAGALAMAFSVTCFVHAQTAPAWTEVGSENGITVFRKEVPGDPVFAYRSEGVLKAPIGKLISVSRDVARETEWVNRLKVARVVREISPLHRIIYLRVGTPWPVSDRDFVLESKLKVDRAHKTAVFDIRSIEDPAVPLDACCVRAQVHYNRIELAKAEGDSTKIHAEAHVDPRGSLPAWLVNRIQKTFPRKSIEGLLKQVAKPDIQDFFATP